MAHDSPNAAPAGGGLVLPEPPPGWAPCEEPATPTDYGPAFSLPEHQHRLLQQVNPHPRDERIVFYPGPHEYRVDGVPTSGSVTGLVHAFAEEFNEKSVIARMMAGRNWPRAGYLRSPPPEAALRELEPHPEAEALLAALRGRPVQEEAAAALAQALKKARPALAVAVHQLGLSAEEIKKKWEDNRVESANRGTWMHLTFELWLNRDPVPMAGPEMALFQKFVRGLSGMTAYRTEWEVYGEEENLAGSIDFVARADDGSLVLMDWKRRKQLRDHFSNSYRTLRAPLDHIDDCGGQLYRLQLNCYRYLIEKYYDHKVSRMRVVCTHPDNGEEAFVHEVPVLKAETDYLMWWQRNRVSANVERRMLSQLGRPSEAAESARAAKRPRTGGESARPKFDFIL